MYATTHTTHACTLRFLSGSFTSCFTFTAGEGAASGASFCELPAAPAPSCELPAAPDGCTSAERKKLIIFLNAGKAFHLPIGVWALERQSHTGPCSSRTPLGRAPALSALTQVRTTHRPRPHQDQQVLKIGVACSVPLRGDELPAAS